jgi:ABC-type branched-subunit amino acid transport system substrate-binding protein
VEGYDPDAVDLQAEIKKLVGLYYLTSREKKLIAERERLNRRQTKNRDRLAQIARMHLPPYVDFDALFIPDVAGKVGLILPQLRLYDIKGVQFMGTSDWNDSKLIEIAGRDASGVVFTDAFHAQSQDPTVSEFVSRFRSSYVREPDFFAAQGYDTASILRTLIDKGPLTRTQLQQDLLRVTDYPGSSGLTSFDDDGDTKRALHLLTVHRGNILDLDELR